MLTSIHISSPTNHVQNVDGARVIFTRYMSHVRPGKFSHMLTREGCDVVLPSAAIAETVRFKMRLFGFRAIVSHEKISV